MAVLMATVVKEVAVTTQAHACTGVHTHTCTHAVYTHAHAHTLHTSLLRPHRVGSDYRRKGDRQLP